MARFGAVAVAITLLAAAGMPAASAAGTEPPLFQIAPGLWEMTTRIKAGDVASRQAMEAAEARMAALSPAQRRQLEQTLAARGVDVRIGTDAFVARVCITREMARQGAIASPGVVGNCRTERSQRSGNTIRFAASCSQPRSTTEGITSITSAKSIESTTTTTSELDGSTRMSTVEQSGRWIADDCGPLAGAVGNTAR